MAQQQTRTQTRRQPASAPPPAKDRGAAPAAGQQQASPPLPAVGRPRLPWNPAMGDQFGELGVTAVSWRTLVEAVWPEAKTVEAVGMALSYCQARKLDPFKRPVHIVPVWHSGLGKMVETVWPGISELRTTAARTGEYAGKDKVTYGPMVSQKVGKSDVTFPEWAQITVYRMVQGQRVAFEGDEVYWLEAYAQKGGKDKDASPNAMWSKRTRGQLAKVAEAMALRQAFPEELGGTYSAEEMEGQTIGHDNAIEGTFTAKEPRQRRTMDLATGDVIDQSPPPHDPAQDPPSAPEDESQEVDYEEAAGNAPTAGQAPAASDGDAQRIAEDSELVRSIEEALQNEPPIDRHLAMIDAIEDLRDIAQADGWPDKLRARAAALVKIHDEDKAKADAIVQRKRESRK